MTPLLAMQKMKMQRADLAWFLDITPSNISQWQSVPAKHELAISAHLELTVKERKEALARIELVRKRPVAKRKPRIIKGEGYARV